MTCKHCESMFSAWLDDRLPPGDSARVEEHLAECGRCRAQLDSWRAASRSLRAQAPATVPAGLADRAWRAAMAPQADPGFVDGFIFAGGRAAIAGAVAAAAVWSGLFAWGGADVLKHRAEPVPQDVIEIAASVWTEEALHE